jgi:broad specificity phosphatase PhoE
MVEGKDEAVWPLWKDGELQARQTGEWLRDHHGHDYVGAYTSPFLRAKQTAELLAIEGIEWTVDERIRERLWGDYGPETMPLYTTHEYMSDIHKCGYPTWRTRLPGGEAVIDLYPEADAFLREVIAETTGGKVLIVTHGGTMRAMQMVLEGVPIDQPELCPKIHTENCSIMHYILDEISDDRSKWTVSRQLITPWQGQF